MQLTSLAAVALLAEYAAAQNMLRFACSQLVVDRIDPIVEPGRLYSGHLHQIVGGNSLNVTMDPKSHDLASMSTCTSCNFAEDFSNYWTAVMFFKHKNGSFMRVPQVGNGGPQGQLVNKGGLDVYYMKSGKVTSFKPGFRMTAGSAANTDTTKVKTANFCHRCWKSTNDNQFTGGAPCTGGDTAEIPTDASCKMIRTTLIFPHCWDGKNLDSPDHQSHMSFGSGSGATGGGACPSTHPVKVPQIMYELMSNVSMFTPDMWSSTRAGSLVYSMGTGGAANHGDYVFGWKGDTLQKAMDNNCNLNANCPTAGITAQTPAKYNACTIRQQSPESVDGWLKALPLGEPAIKA